MTAEVTYVNKTSEAADPFCGGGSAVAVDQDGRRHDMLPSLFSIPGNTAICSGAGTLPGDKTTVTIAFKLKKGQRFSHLDMWNSKYAPDFDGEASRLRFRR